MYNLPGMYGDKDTFRVAFALAEDSWAYRQVPHPPSIAIIDQFAVGETNVVRWYSDAAADDLYVALPAVAKCYWTA